MDMKRYLDRMFAYDDWANRVTLASLKMAAPPPPRSLKLMAHIVATERLWMSRLKQDEKTVVVWPELTLDDSEAQIKDLSQLWQVYLDGLTFEGLSQSVAYVNSKGESWTNRVEDMLMHVVMHSAYHRGQIASDLRASGHEPAYTDFIHCVRQGFVE